MDIPARVRIGAHDYEVIFDDVDGDSDSRFGHCYPRKLQIYIDPRVSPSQQEETFIHEVAHAICSQVRAFPPTESGADEEERIVQSLCHGLYQCLKDNALLR
jgi:hypothetical protein